MVKPKLINQPCRYTIPTKFFSNQILMEIDQCINSVLSSHVDQFLHCVKISLIVPIFFRFNSSPHHAQSDSIVAQFGAVNHILFGKRHVWVIIINVWQIWGTFYHNVCPMNCDLPAFVIYYFSIFNRKWLTTTQK